MKLSLMIVSVFVWALQFGFQPTFAQSTMATAAPSTQPSTAPSDDAYLDPPQVPLSAGLTSLFDGKSLAGWVSIPANNWAVKNNALASLGLGRGVIYTDSSYDAYRIVFDIRHIIGKKDHAPCVLFFCTAPANGAKPLDALAGIQFQVPTGDHWDYRKGHNNAGKGEFTTITRRKFNVHQWSRVEILVDPSNGTARMAVAQPVGSKAVEIVDFKDPTAGRSGPFALQMHNKGLFDEYANLAIELNPTDHNLLTTK
ncbi:MAG: DUF1080 domain-containing protein [Planctomycetota bacterium]|nr:DUF1080 domain-containing protein [Planctomycetota bacterium]